MPSTMELVGYFMCLGFLATLVLIGAPIAAALVGKTTFLEMAVLLILMYIVSFFLLRDEPHKRFYLIVRVSVVVILFEMVLLGGTAVLARSQTTNVGAALIPIAIIAIYEIFRLGIRLKTEVETKEVPKVRVRPPPPPKEENEDEKEKKKTQKTSLVSSLRERSEETVSRDRWMIWSLKR